MNDILLVGAVPPWGWGLIVVGSVLALVLLGLWFRPDAAVRPLLWISAHTLYRIRVLGRASIPANGPVLFVCNHVSYIDALLLFTAQRRPVRFIVWAPF